MKQYNIRLEELVVQQLDNIDGCRSKHIRDAINLYLNGVQHVDNDNTYSDQSENYIQHLKTEVDYLRQQNNALLVSKMPLLQRVIQRLKSQ